MDKARLGFTTIRRRISSCTRNSIQPGICPIIRPLAVAMMRTAIRPRSSMSTATSTRNAEKTENTFPCQSKRSSVIETIPMAEIISALHRPAVPTRPIRCSVSHWEAPHEIYPGEWQDTLPAVLVCDVRSAGRSKLPAGSRDAPRLLRSRLLRSSLQQRRPASRKSGKSIMSLPRPNKPVLWPELAVMLLRWARPMVRYAYTQEGITRRAALNDQPNPAVGAKSAAE